MSRVTQRLKRCIIMLLVCALVAANIPMNAFAAELDNTVITSEEQVVDTDTEATVSDNDTEGDALQNLEEESEESVEFREESLEKFAAEVSGNDTEVFDSNMSSDENTGSENIAGGTIENGNEGVTWYITSAGKLVVTGKGDAANYPWYEYKEQILSAELNLSEMESLSNFFDGCTNLKEVDFTNLNTETVKSMNNMFYMCSALTAVDMSNLDLKNVSEANCVFLGCDELMSINTPVNLKIDIDLPEKMGEFPIRSWYEFKTDNTFTVLPKEQENSIQLLKREIGFGNNVSLTLQDSGNGSVIYIGFSASKNNNKQYIYNINFYYNDKVLENYTLFSVQDSLYSGSNPIDVSDAFGGNASGAVTIYAKAFIDGYEVAKSNEITINIAAQRLQTPKVTVTGKTISWEPVEGADRYHIQLLKKTGTNHYTVMQSGNYYEDSSVTSFNFSNIFEIARIHIRALSDNYEEYLHSDFVQQPVEPSFVIDWVNEYVGIEFVSGCVNEEYGVVTTKKDTDVKFKATLNESADKMFDIGQVYYQMNDSAEPVVLNKNSSGYYVIPYEEIISDFAIRAEVIQHSTEIEFNYDETSVTVKDVKSGSKYVPYKSYYLPYEGELKFKLDIKEGFEADSVEICNQVLEPDANGIYTYHLTESGAIWIMLKEEVTETAKITWFGDNYGVELVSEHSFEEPIEGEEGKSIVSLVEKQQLRFRLNPKENYEIATVKIGQTQEDAKTLEKDKDGIYTVLGREYDQNIYVTMRGKILSHISGVEGSWIEENGDVSIIVGGDYSVSLEQYISDKEAESGYSVVKAQKSELLDGGKPYKYGGTYVDPEQGIVYFGISSVSYNSIDNPNNMQLNITTEQGDITSIPIKVSPTINAVSISGVSNKKLTQQATTENTYVVNVTPKMPFDIIGVQVVDTDGVVEQALINDDGNLYIKTTKRNGTAEIKLYNIIESYINEENAEHSWYDYIKGGTFTLVVPGPKMTTVKPTVSLQSASNSAFTLKLGAAGFDLPTDGGKVWYEVRADLVTTEEVGVDGNPVETKVVSYFPYMEAGTQTETVAIADMTKDGTYPVAKYNVTVSLVQTVDEKAPDEEGGDILYRTATNKVNLLKNVSNKAALYETKLTLKKGTTKVFTGQKEIAVATAQFSKTTYFKNLDVMVDSSRVENAAEGDVTAVYNKEDGKIKVSVKDTAKAGKYTIIANVILPEGIQEVSANITIEVVYGINRINLIGVPGTIYKENGKTTSVIIDYEPWHQVSENAKAEPYKKDVVFSLISAGEKELTEDFTKYVTIDKKGKLTVAKGYSITEDVFCIKAVPADYPDNELGTVISGPIVITSQPQSMGDILIAKREEDGYRVVTREKKVSIDDIKGTNLILLKENVDNSKDFYGDEDEEVFGYNEVKFTSSNKNLMIGNGGYIEGLSKEAKNVNITATLTDGSGMKISLNGMHIVGTQEEVSVKINKCNNLTGEETELPITYTEEGKHTGNYSDELRKTVIEVKVGYGDGFCNKASNFTVSIKGAKTLYKYSDQYTKEQYYRLEPNKKDVVITVTNKNIGKTDVYTITNNDFDKIAKMPALSKAKVVGSYVQYSKTPGYVTVEVPAEYNGKLVKVSVDNTKYEKDNKYRDFVACIDITEPITVENGSIKIPLVKDEIPMNAGSYKLSVCVGMLAADVFVAQTKAKDITVKVTTAKIGKLTTSYTLNLKDTSTMELKTNSKQCEVVSVDDIKNVNIKGTPNRFSQYFTKDGASLKLRDDISAKDLQKLYSGKAKNDMAGYVTCVIKCGDYEYTQTAQIKINTKNAAAMVYSALKPTVLETDKEAIIYVNKTKNKNTNPAKVTAVCAEKDVKVKIADDIINYGNIIVDTSDRKQFKAGKTTSVILYILTEETPKSVKDMYDAVEADEKIGVLKTYGNKITVKITILKNQMLLRRIK